MAKKKVTATPEQKLAAAERRISNSPMSKDEIERVTAALEAAHAELSDPALKTRARIALKRMRLHAQANPLVTRPPKPSNPGGPTPEMQAKRQFQAEVVVPEQAGVPATNRHRTRTALKPYEDYFSTSEWTALEQWYRDGEAYTTLRMTQSYNGMTTAGTGGSRVGGVGPDERLREAHARFAWIRAHLIDIDPILVEIGRWVVLEYRKEELERLPSVAEVGGVLCPNLKDAATRRGVALGAIKVFAMVLRWLYRRDRFYAKQGRPQQQMENTHEPPRISGSVGGGARRRA